MIYAIQTVLLTTLVLFLAANSITGEQKSSYPTYQLPGTSYPLHYSLRLEIPIDLNLVDWYSGHVVISINVPFATNSIVLHADPGIVIHAVGLKWGDSDIPIVAIERDVETQFLRIYTSNLIPSQAYEAYQLLITFSGCLDRNVFRGFFKDSFEKMSRNDTEQSRSFFAMTAFEPTFARKAFPCYDEPKYKTTFDIEVICATEYNVYSNGDSMEEQQLDEFRKLVRFSRTPPMASYLVAILVSEHDELIRDSDGMRIGMLTQPQTDGNGALEFALDITEQSLHAMQDYTAQPYSFSKLYQVAVEDFNGGLENWGLIAYNEAILLVNPAADILEKIDTALLITHEVAHQFFGNLVGIFWWDDLWLKEGFATFMSYKLTLQFLPDGIGIIESKYDQDTWNVLNYDSSPDTHSMYYRVDHPEEIQALYHNPHYMIVYEKASRVIRMMEKALGPEVFQTGIQRYIDANKFTSVSPISLYQSLHEVAAASGRIPEGSNVAQIFDSWVYQAGHPIVYVERVNSWNTYRFTQRPFRSCPSTCILASRWWIPIFFSTQEMDEEIDDELAFWMPPNLDSVIITRESALPLVNARTYGFYRVNYCQQGWSEILRNWYRIGGSARAKLLDDAFSLQWDQETYFEPLFLMLDNLRNDTEPLPWMAAMTEHNLWRMVRLTLGKKDVNRKMETLVKRLTLNMLRLFQDVSSPDGIKAHSMALDGACRLKMSTCQRSKRSVNGVCSRLLSPEYVSGLRCEFRSFEQLISDVNVRTCFTSPEVFQQFVVNVLQNFRCPTMLDLFAAVMNTGAPFVDELLQVLTTQTDYLELISKGQHLEAFLRTAAYSIYNPDQQQSVMRFMEHLEVIKDEQRSAIQNLMAEQLRRVEEVAASLMKYLDSSVIEETETGYEY